MTEKHDKYSMESSSSDNRERIRAPSRDGRDGLTSPRQVLRRLMLLSDGRQYREAAGMVGRLGPSVFRSVVAELPMDILVDALPHSAYLLETFYARLIAVPNATRPTVSAESVMWTLVKLFGNPHESGLRQRCTKLIQCVGVWQPELRELLIARKRELDQAVQGLGLHGLTADYTNALNSLHATLKNELHRHIDTYKIALQKIDELSPITINPDPAFSSHQRLLAIGYGDIQQRLIDNKTLLTVFEKPALKQLHQLVENLSARVQNDKEMLYSVGQIKRIDQQADTAQRPAAGLLMNFSRGCDTVLNIMGAPAELTIAKAPPSPSADSCSSDGYHSDPELDAGGMEMVMLYRKLYVQHRNETLTALDQLTQLKRTNHLKAKILFSIIVLAFRACHALRERKINEVRRILCANGGTTTTIDRAVHEHLRLTADAFPTGDVERQVANQVLVTLHEYPCLENCLPLLGYISACVRLAWKMANHTTPYYLDLDFTLGAMRADKHDRHPVSDSDSETIRAFIWPALVQDERCVFKAVVAT